MEETAASVIEPSSSSSITASITRSSAADGDTEHEQ